MVGERVGESEGLRERRTHTHTHCSWHTMVEWRSVLTRNNVKPSRNPSAVRGEQHTHLGICCRDLQRRLQCSWRVQCAHADHHGVRGRVRIVPVRAALSAARVVMPSLLGCRSCDSRWFVATTGLSRRNSSCLSHRVATNCMLTHLSCSLVARWPC